MSVAAPVPLGKRRRLLRERSRWQMQCIWQADGFHNERYLIT